MKKAAENRLDKNEKTRALFVKNVVQENIIGKARENNGNAKNHFKKWNRNGKQ